MSTEAELKAIKREVFAAMAMHGLLTSHETVYSAAIASGGNEAIAARTVAISACAFADALIAELAKP